jgi:hypothetical protein
MMAQSILLNTDQLVQKNCNGRVQMRKPYMGKFSVKRRAAFLDHLAATCNVKVAAENSGVTPSAAYQWRRRDAVFAEQWQAALETGYACLETMLLARPLPPVHVAAAFNFGGGVDIQWIRRSRIDFGWNDGVDQPLSEDSESYEVTLITSGQSRGSWIIGEPKMTVSAQALSQYQLASGTLFWFEISQIGRYARSAFARTASLLVP